MIISHKFEFVFIKTAKTAGTSIETYLSPLCGPEDVFTPFAQPEEGHEPRNWRGVFSPGRELRAQLSAGTAIRNSLRRTVGDLLYQRRFFHHIPAWLVRCRAKAEFDSYLTFCVVRDPWEVVLSGYKYNRAVKHGSVSVDAYLARLGQIKRRNGYGVGRWPMNLWNYVDPESGKILVDRVLRYEHLDSELNDLFNEIGVPYDGTLSVKRKTLRGDVVDRFSDEHRRIVGELYREELDFHGYPRPA